MAVFLLLAGAAAAGVYNYLAPESLARIHGRFFGQPLEVRGLELTYGREPIILATGGELEVNPAEVIKLVGLNTNRWRNYDLRLYSPDIDIDYLMRGTDSLLNLLGEKYFLEPRIFRLQVKDEAEVKTEFLIKAALTSLDWSVRGDAAVEIEKKIGYYRKALELDPDSAELKERLLQALEQAGLYEEMAQLLENELAETVDEQKAGEILARLPGLYRRTENQAKEIDASERLLAWNEKNGRPVQALKSGLAALYRHQNPQKAASLYEELLAGAEAEHQRAFLQELVSIYRETDLTLQQIGAWERLLELTPPEETPVVWSHLLELKEASGDEAGQREAWAGLAQSLPDGPDKANAYKRLGYLWFSADDNVKAEEAFGAAALLDQKDPALFVNLARLAMAEGDRAAYRENLGQALRLKNSADLTKELALACESDGLKEQAIELWLSLAESKDGQAVTAEVQMEAASRLINLLRPTEDDFSEEFERRIYQFSKNPVEFYNLGVARFKTQNWTEALKAFEKAVELDKDASLTFDIRGYLLPIYQELGQLDKMAEQAMELYRADSTKKECRDLLLNRFEESKNWAGLIEAAQNWTKWHPTDADNWRFLALGQKNQELEAESAQSLVKAAELDSGKAASWLAAAEALEKAGDIESAKTAYTKVTELEPSNERAESALLRLALANLELNRRNRQQ
ncbi:MAG: tetratricopeptide repeat protein [Deltaproteobacteria bacterium]|nr:tetratricopeptide repeat protein [Deltaproteobacteria bacterium]